MTRTLKTMTVWLVTAALIHGHWLAALAGAGEMAPLAVAAAPKIDRDKQRPSETLQVVSDDSAGIEQWQAVADIAYLPPDATAGIVLHPSRVLSAPESELLPLEVISAAGKKEWGLDPLELEWVVGTIVVSSSGPPMFGLVLRTSAPVDDSALLPSLKRNTDAQTLDGRPYYRAQDPMIMPSIYLPDDRTVIIAQEGMLQKILKSRRDTQPGKVGRLLQEMTPLPDAVLVLDFEPLRPLVQGFLMQDPPPPQFRAIEAIPALVQTAELHADIVGSPHFYIALHAKSAADAMKLQNVLSEIMETGKQTLLSQLQEAGSDDDPIRLAMAQYVERLADRYFGYLRPERKGKVVFKDIQGEKDMQMATIGIMVALILPAVQAAREAARRSQAMNNLKQLGLALLNYHDLTQKFPARAVFDSEGRPLLSWRIQILPFIECNDLYDQFHLDEPWDSEHNRKLIPLMPEVFANPSAPQEPGKAHYLGLVGPGTLFEGSEGHAFRDITDGTSNSIMLVEVNPDRAVIWTKPEDIPFDPENPLDGLGNAHPGGFNVLFCDGSVRFISETIDREVFRRMATIGDGKPLGDF